MNFTDSSVPISTELTVARKEALAQLADLDTNQVLRARHEIADIWLQIINKLEAAGETAANLRPFIYQARLWFLQARERFTRLYGNDNSGSNLSERFSQWNEDFLPPEAIALFEERYSRLNSNFWRARYADFLAVSAASQPTPDKKMIRHWALEAIPYYLESARLFASSNAVYHVIEAGRALDGAADLASSVAQERVPDVAQALSSHIAAIWQQVQQNEGIVSDDIKSDELTIQNSPPGRWALEAGSILLGLRQKFGATVNDSFLEQWQQIASELGTRNEPSLEQAFLAQAAEAARWRGQSEERYQLMLRVGQSKIREARARTQEPGASFLAAAGILEQAIEFFDRLKSTNISPEERAKIVEEQRLLKLEIRRYYGEGEKEFGVVSSSIDIEQETLEQAVAPYLQPANLKECLQRLGASLLPDLNQAQIWAEEHSKGDSFRELFGTSILSDGMTVSSAHTDEEKFQFEFHRALDLQIATVSGIWLPIIWERLRKEKSLTAEALMEYLDQWGQIEEDNRPLIRLGIERYFAEDFASALHLLVPQLEDVIRTLFERAGLPSVQFSKDGQKFETFGALLNKVNETLPNLVPQELSKYIKRTLTDSTGWNLRNKIAHGMIRLDECNRRTVEVVLHLYLIFSLFQEISDSNSEG